MPDSAILVCDLERGELAPPLRGHEHIASALALSADGRLLASAGLDQSLRLWDTDSAKAIHVWPKQPAVMAALAFSPDGHILVSADGSPRIFAYGMPDTPRIRFWNVVSGREIAHREGHQAQVWAFAFSPDGKRLASVQSDSTVLVWDVAFLADVVQVKATDLDRAGMPRAWDNLADADARKAHQAVWDLSAAPRQAVPFLKERLRPVAAIEDARVRKWIAELDSEDFKAREAAFKALAQADRQVESALRRTLADKPSLEMRRRVEDLLRHLLKAPPAETLRSLRAIAVLEHIGTSEARQVLQALAHGAPAARETEAAANALKRKR